MKTTKQIKTELKKLGVTCLVKKVQDMIKISQPCFDKEFTHEEQCAIFNYLKPMNVSGVKGANLSVKFHGTEFKFN